MIRACPDPDLFDDRLNDRVRRDRAGEALEDPGKALCLGAPADLEHRDRLPVTECGKADDDDEPGGDPVEGAGVVREDPQRGDQPEEHERAAEDDPGSADPAILRLSDSVSQARLSHVRGQG